MESLVNLILVNNDLLATFVNMFVFVFALDFSLEFAYIIKSSVNSARG